MIAGNHTNIKMLRTVARRFGPLRERAVFLGGCATYLLITDNAQYRKSDSGHLRPDKASQARIPLLIERVKMIATPK